MRRMKTNLITRKVIKVQAKIVLLHEEIKALQVACTHPELFYLHEGDTGNWCRSDDSYWTSLYCVTCKKRWTEEGSLSPKGATLVRDNNEFRKLQE